MQKLLQSSLSRRRLLRLGGMVVTTGLAGCALPSVRSSSRPAATGGGAGVTAQVPSRPLQASRGDATYDIVAREVDWELAPGKVIRAMTYNGALPGQLIRAREGQRVRITLHNELREPTTIHWHGIDVPNNMDGVPDLSQLLVQSGASFVYEFEARPAGTRWYHTHFHSEQQLDAGLAAAFIIDPIAPEPSIDRDYTLVLDDFITTGAAQSATSGQTDQHHGMAMGATALPKSPESTNGSEMMGGGGNGMMGSGGMMGNNPRVDEKYDTFTINGKAFPATENLNVKKGERVQLRLINASNMQTFVVRLLGHTLSVTHTDGNPLRAPVEVDAVPIAPSERYDVAFIADNPGKWLLSALDQVHAERGLATYVVYQGSESATTNTDDAKDTRKLKIWNYHMGEGIDLLPNVASEPGVHALTLSGGGMMGSGLDDWAINGLKYPDTDPIQVRHNDSAVLQISNMSAELHPMHLHGQSFRVLSVNGAQLRAPLIKDTVAVSAHMGTTNLGFVASNPGDWMFHCHKPMHMDAGMISLVKIA